MAVKPIVVWPDNRLRQPTHAVTEITDEVRALYRDLVDTMYARNGLGIAAIQIGDPTRMFIVEPELAGKTADAPPVAFINPEVVWTSDETRRADEGCLSFPGIYVPVERPIRARVRAMGLDGQTFEVEGEDLFARCMLHENDHLTGQLLVDFVGPLKRQMIRRKLSKRAAEDAA
jgi:peptide deformylase